MPDYRRYYVKGGTYFFTVVTYQRHPYFTDESAILLFKQCLDNTKKIHPFNIDAIVILPDHIHTIWTLPNDDADFSKRWKIIKSGFSKNYPLNNHELISRSRLSKGEKSIWQRRFWEHLIKDQDDFNKHLDYIHYNPVKHNFVDLPGKWKYSSFLEYVKIGIYEMDWCQSAYADFTSMDLE